MNRAHRLTSFRWRVRAPHSCYMMSTSGGAKRTVGKRLTLVNAQEETWRARLDCEWVATVEVLRDVAGGRGP
jgi:hypothetical protein